MYKSPGVFWVVVFASLLLAVFFGAAFLAWLFWLVCFCFAFPGLSCFGLAFFGLAFFGLGLFWLVFCCFAFVGCFFLRVFLGGLGFLGRVLFLLFFVAAFFLTASATASLEASFVGCFSPTMRWGLRFP